MMRGPERFSRLKFPIHKIEARDLPDLFRQMPGLRRFFQSLNRLDDVPKSNLYRDDQGNDHTAKVIKYIVLLYDENSDLVDEYPDDLRLRKEAGAREAGFKRKDGKWPDFLVEIMEMRDRQAIEWMIDYRKTQKSSVFTDIRLIEDEIETINRRRVTELYDSDFSKKNDLLEAVQKRRTELENLYKKFWAESRDLKQVGEEILHPVSPENVFKELKLPDEIIKIRQVADVS